MFKLLLGGISFWAFAKISYKGFEIMDMGKNALGVVLLILSFPLMVLWFLMWFGHMLL